MEIFNNFLNNISNLENRNKFFEVLKWVHKTYPNLSPIIKWNQPMFIAHGTYIIGFSVAKQHFACAPEAPTIQHFKNALENSAYTFTNNIIKIKWSQSVDYKLLKEIIDFNISDKAKTKQFWR